MRVVVDTTGGAVVVGAVAGAGAGVGAGVTVVSAVVGVAEVLLAAASCSASYAFASSSNAATNNGWRTGGFDCLDGILGFGDSLGDTNGVGSFAGSWNLTSLAPSFLGFATASDSSSTQKNAK